MPLLILESGTDHEWEHRWHGKNCTIGRAPTNDVILEEASVSANHARLEKRGDEFWLVDLESRNASRINGKRIKEEQLKDGDTIRIGKTTEIRFLAADKLGKDKDEDTEAALPIPEKSQEREEEPVGAGAALVRSGGHCTSCGTFLPFAVNFCPRCGQNAGPVQGTALAMHQPGMGYGGAMGMAGDFLRPMDQGGRGAGIFPLLAFLCGLASLGFGGVGGVCHASGISPTLLMVFYSLAIIAAFFAIILGMVALAQIRKFGGFQADRRNSMWGLSAGFFGMLGCVVGIVLLLTTSHVREQQDLYSKKIAENETFAQDALFGIARAEKFAKAIHSKDPNESGISQYLSLEELVKVGSSFFNRDLASGNNHGYRFHMREANVNQFEMVAEPEKYGQTGKLTFSIDHSGLLRGKDLEAKSFAQAGAVLPELNTNKTAFDADDAIAADVIAFAKRLAGQGLYEQSRKILDEVRDHFAVTKAAQELLALEKSVDPFIIEAQAQTRFQQAQRAATEGDLKLAIGRLKEISDLYPSYTKIATVTEQMGKYQTDLAQKVDKEAKTLFDKAEALEREGKPTDAQDVYVQIEKNYPDTDWAKRITTLKPALQQAIREKSAEKLLADARNLSLSTDYQAVVNLLEQLQRNYSDTDFIGKNAESIASLTKKAQGQLYRSVATQQMNAGQDGSALAKLEEACAKNPDLRLTLKDLFLKLYLRVAQKRLDEGDERDALALYRKYLTLEPEQSEVNPAILTRLNFVVAKAEFSLGNFKTAEQNLLGARTAFAEDAEYNDLFGSVKVALGKYEEAIPSYDKAVALTAKTPKPKGNYFARRGYLLLLSALQIEKEAFTAFATLTPDIAATAGGDPALSPASPGGSTLSPEGFATVLPTTTVLAAADQHIRYDAMASQKLRDEVLDLLTQIRSSYAGPAKSPPAAGGATTNAPAAPGGVPSAGGSAATTVGGGPATPSVNQANAEKRIQRVRTGLDLTNQLSIVHQKVLDENMRKKKTVEALYLMLTRLDLGNRDFANAARFDAADVAALAEIQKATLKHQEKIIPAVKKIGAFLSREIEVVQDAYATTESVCRISQMQHLSAPSDPTVSLGIKFSKLLDRRDFDEGMQLLREASQIKVPFDLYSLAGQKAPEPNPPPALNNGAAAAPLLPAPQPAK